MQLSDRRKNLTGDRFSSKSMWSIADATATTNEKNTEFSHLRAGEAALLTATLPLLDVILILIRLPDLIELILVHHLPSSSRLPRVSIVVHHDGSGSSSGSSSRRCRCLGLLLVILVLRLMMMLMFQAVLILRLCGRLFGLPLRSMRMRCGRSGEGGDEELQLIGHLVGNVQHAPVLSDGADDVVRLLLFVEAGE